MDNLSKLPPPPKGQTGVTLDSFAHLPPPPKGQTGVTLEQIKSQQPELTTKEKLNLEPSYGARVAEEQLGGIQKLQGSIEKGAQDLQAGKAKGGISGFGQALTGAAKAGFGTISGLAQTAFAPVTPIVQAITPTAIQSLRTLNPQLAQAYDAVAPKIQEIASKNPESATLVGDVVNTILLGLGGGLSEGAIKEGIAPSLTKESLAGLKEGLTKDAITGDIKGAISGIKEKIAGTPTSISEKALSLNEKELGAVDKTKLKYLTDKGFDMTKTEGGTLKNKSYQMTEKVKGLANDFKDVLTGKTPEENIQNVQKELTRLQNESKTAFEGANKSINKNQLVTGIKKSISKMNDSIYEGYTKAQQDAFSNKRISDFLSHVKEGNLKGLDDALESFRSANIKADATISKAADSTYKAVKQYIIDNLPKEKAELYKSTNTAQAKLFDVAEILKGKIQASVGTLNKAGKILKNTGLVTGGIVGEKLLKQVPGIGQFLP